MRYILCYYIFCLCACSKFLDKKPDATQAVPVTISDLQALLDNSTAMNYQRTPGFGEASADDFYVPDAQYASLDEDPQSVYRWQRLAYTFGNDWNLAYQCVYHANFCLEGIEKIPGSSANMDGRNNVKGSALFFRAYYYLGLIWQHGKAYDKATADNDLGIVLRSSSDFNAPSVRSTVADCYRQIIGDALEASELLPELPQNRMRPSRAAAYGLLARTYLSMREYDSAYYYSGIALQLHAALIDYTLRIPQPANNPEILLETSMMTSISLVTPGSSLTDSGLVALYQPGDQRKTRYFEFDGNNAYYVGSYTGNFGIHFTGLATDELLLMRAECAARLDKHVDAMNNLNSLLETRWDDSFVPLTAANAEEALNIILTERRKSLLYRGLRFMDIKRLNKEGRNIILHRIINGQPFTLLPESSYYALPLPQDIIDQTGIAQNE